MSEIGIFVDFGSTYTKVVAFDLDEERIIGQGRSVSTVKTDITTGLKAALERLEKDSRRKCVEEACVRLACSSAAGGLRLAVIGLVPNLTVKAARLAALGAGAKVVGTYSYKLNRREIWEMEQLVPDIILLAGGTDGGNEEVIAHNAQMLTQSSLGAPIVVAGNKACADDIRGILESNGRYVTVVENVLGELDKLNVEPSRAAIREIFMQRIVHAKGLDKAKELIDSIIMPTPMAALRSAELLSVGAGDEKGLGELMVVDIGGATTDVHSISHGYSKNQRVVRRGIPEPFAKRTVEGDLGIRYNALSILEEAGEVRVLENSLKSESLVDLEGRVRYLSEHIEAVPEKEDDRWLDIGLARTALEIAVERHVGHLEQVFSPDGTIFIQFGKDLTDVINVIGTGGIFAYGQEPLAILEGALFSEENPLLLKPKSPDFFIDRNYILYAIGLLAEKAPEKALRIGKKYLEKAYREIK
ncbi:MAG: glutamate mutase L [Deltaproteobacteria bacterium]|nr:MAG: glutamate mutase L [Deltaproteobacteria bacterium]